MSKTKKSFLIATVVVAMVLAVAGISFAAWAVEYKNADDNWTITAKTPGELTITEIGDVMGGNYNGQTGELEDVYTTSRTMTVTSTTAITLASKLTLTNGETPLMGSTVAITNAGGESVTALEAGVATEITVTVTFGDYSAMSFYGATFKIAIELGVIA